MNNLIEEEGAFGANPGARDLAYHLFTRMHCGRVVIVAENPLLLMPTLRKQWLRLARKVQKERARTINPTRIRQLVDFTSHMYNVRFTTHYPSFEREADIYILSLDQTLALGSGCWTMYVTCHATRQQLRLITTSMPRGSLLVICRFR
jgi:hypothetical protein